MPIDRLLVETDAPDMLPPDPFRPYSVVGKGGCPRNEPANIPAIIRGLAALRPMSEDQLAQVSWENGQRLLGALRG